MIILNGLRIQIKKELDEDTINYPLIKTLLKAHKEISQIVNNSTTPSLGDLLTEELERNEWEHQDE